MPNYLDFISTIDSARRMHEAVSSLGIVPFFKGGIPGYSIEEMTRREFWITSESLGPWDWKIDLVQSQDIIYGKFLKGARSAFMTRECFSHLANYRRSCPRYTPKEGSPEEQVLELLRKEGSLSTSQIRRSLGLKKAKTDSVLGSLQFSTLSVIGDIQRVYRGPTLAYSGWQTAFHCLPEALWDEDENLPYPFKAEARAFLPDCRAEESASFLRNTVRKAVPFADQKEIDSLLDIR